jgi:hypothetical protein
MTGPLFHDSWRRWSSRLLLCFSVWVGLLAGCSGGGDPAFSSVGDTPVVNAFPDINDVVFAWVADGSGGVYAGGRFTQVGPVPRQALAHILGRRHSGSFMGADSGRTGDGSLVAQPNVVRRGEFFECERRRTLAAGRCRASGGRTRVMEPETGAQRMWSTPSPCQALRSMSEASLNWSMPWLYPERAYGVRDDET